MEFKEVSPDSFVLKEKFLLDWYGMKRIVYYESDYPLHITVKDKGTYVNYPTQKIKVYKPVFNKKKIQDKMEYRALIQIIRRVLSDPYFQWL